MPVLSEFSLPGHSEITIIKTDQEGTQAYWEIVGLGKNLSSSKDEDKIRSHFANERKAVQGQLRLIVAKVGDPAEERIATQVTAQDDTIDARLLWTRSIYNKFYQTWNVHKLNRTHFLESDVTRPTLVDLISFAFDSTCQPEGAVLQPLALSLVRQLAEHVDKNLRQLSLEPMKEEEHRAKNRKVDNSIFLQKITRAALFLLNENVAGSRTAQNFSFF
eukprot:s2314_g11.t1